MKANLDMLKEALKLTAQAHRNAEFCDWSEDGQLGIRTDGLPTYTDVKTICKAFFGKSDMVKMEWGFVNIYFGNCDMLPDVDIPTLNMALPFMWINKISGMTDEDKKLVEDIEKEFEDDEY